MKKKLNSTKCFIGFWVLLIPAFAAATPTNDWLNVKELGVSGSEYMTLGTTTAGSNRITVKDVGDFKVGQSVIIRGCNVNYPEAFVRKGMYDKKPLTDLLQIRGYNGASNGWMVFILDIDGISPLTFRWSDNLGRTWNALKVSITGDWQKLSGGVEIRFISDNIHLGQVFSFHATDLLFTTIDKIEGNVFILTDTANMAVQNASILHEDSEAIQATINIALEKKKNLYFPSGRYRLKKELIVKNAAGIQIEGASGETAILDISFGMGACISLLRGGEVTIRNFKMIGHTGVLDKPTLIQTSGNYGIWGMHLKPCNAVEINGTEEVLIENVHASKMTMECFYSGGPGREGNKERTSYTKSITYLRCSVTDCGSNAFNNNDMAENINILYCRIENIGKGSWEGPGRFVRIIGNYIRNSGAIAVGNMFHRYKHLNEFGVAQTIVKDNVIEGVSPDGPAIRVAHGATQVIITNNIFVNYGSTAIRLDAIDKADFSKPVIDARSSYPPANVVVSGNIIDLTQHNDSVTLRTGIDIGVSNVEVSDNQVFFRGMMDQKLTGIRIRESAVNINLHDNLIRNCNTGIATQRVRAFAGEVISRTSFLRRGALLPLPWPEKDAYRGWHIVWLHNETPTNRSIIDHWDPNTLQFHLTAPHIFKEGDAFEIYPAFANWNIHNNTISDCLNPIVLDGYGSPTSVISSNTIMRGNARSVEHGVYIKGNYKFINNHIIGFDEGNSVALKIHTQSDNKATGSLYRNNIFEKCHKAVFSENEYLWTKVDTSLNTFIECSEVPF